MKKRLLLQLVALLSVLGANALTLGDYIYTADAKFKVTGENLVANGNFATAIGTEWAAIDGSAYNPEYWSVEAEDGVTFLKSLSQATGASLYQPVPIEPNKIYIVSMKMKAGAEGPFGTVTAAATVGRVDVFANIDGTGSTVTTQVAGSSYVGADWTEVAFSYNSAVAEGAEAMAFLNIVFEQIPVGTQITDINVREVTEVYDTRKADRSVAYARTLLSIADFEEGAKIAGTTEVYNSARSAYEEVLSYVVDALADEAQRDDINTMNELVGELETQQDAFLDGCAGDVKLTTGDWANIPYNKNANSISAWNYWKIGGGRGFSRDVTTGEDGYGYFAASIAGNGNYGLDMTMRVTDEDKDVKLSPGKYFFSIEAKGYWFGATAATNYTPDYSQALVGPTIFVGKDTVTLEEDTVPGRYWKTYYKIAEIQNGDVVTAGFIFPHIAKGGQFMVRRAQFRAIGKDAETLAREAAVRAFNTQQSEVEKRVETINGLLNTKPWENDSLQRALEAVAETRSTALTYVALDGTDLGTATMEDLEGWGGNNGTLMTAVRTLQNAINYYNNQNAPYEDLKTVIADTKEAIADEGYASANKTTINAAIDKAQALVDAASSKTAADAAEYTAEADALRAALSDFKLDNATYNNPGEFVVEDPTFAKGTGGQAANGWIFEGTAARYRVNSVVALDGEQYEGNRCFNVSRNRPTNTLEIGKAYQRVTVNRKGYYEYRAKVHAVTWRDNFWNLMVQTQEVTDPETEVTTIDTLRNANGTAYRLSGVRMWFGEENTTNVDDSVDVANLVVENSEYTTNAQPEHLYTVSLFYEKTTDGDTSVEFGLDGTYNGKPTFPKTGRIRNTYCDGAGFGFYGFGSSHLYYYPSKDIYDAGVAAGIEEVSTEQRPVQQGVYNLSGVKLSGKNLQKGIYIINGKKVIK